MYLHALEHIHTLNLCHLPVIVNLFYLQAELPFVMDVTNVLTSQGTSYILLAFMFPD